MLLTRVLELDEQRQQSHEPEKGHCCREKEATREKISKGKGSQKVIYDCGFCSNRILHYFPMLVSQCVSHRRDISSFLDNLIV